MGTMFHIGQKFTLIQGDANSGAIIEALTDVNGQGAGFALVLYMPRATDEEIRLFNSERVNVRIIKETNSFSLSIFRFGNTPLIYEAAFDPTLYTDNRAMQLALESNFLYMFIVDTDDDNRIKAMRAGSFPRMMRTKLLSVWTNAVKQSGFRDKYQAWVHDLWSRYTTKQLWKIADYSGWIGD
ncbi:hypothetical protein M5X11_16025 [Paenibacillus alginolyticus]|uniref:hypothetical protein n=1 Tax=Paenibacillus alginolyticus TaxID=59839 RepID=UPI000492A2EE|nr:hypothetical protein [Paenibacillus alginolyticus]MCY9666452.1 hypothetical protein [Paenibacillus alginolyticus]